MIDKAFAKRLNANLSLALCAGLLFAVGGAVGSAADSAVAEMSRPPADTQPCSESAQTDIGAMSKIGAATVLQATQLVKKGFVSSLAIVTNGDTPAYGSRAYQVLVREGGDPIRGELGRNGATGFEETIISSPGVGTKVSGFAHAGTQHNYYNCAHAKDFYTDTGLKRHSIDQLPPMVTRGVLIDIAAAKGVNALAPSSAIEIPDIKAALARQQLTLAEGDAIILHTGFMQAHIANADLYLHRPPGLSLEAARYLVAQGASLIGADTPSIEVIPGLNKGEAIPVHIELLSKRGVLMLHNAVTETLAAEKIYRFLFTMAAPRFAGTAQMVVQPVAIH